MIRKRTRIVRVIQWFPKKGGFLIDEEEIKNFDLELFRKLFNHTYEDDPYIYGGGYNILEEHIPIVQKYINHKINLKKYKYQFGTYES